MLIVLGDSHLQYLLFVGDFELFVDFVFNRETVTVPPESSRNIVSSLGGISADDILDGSCSDVPIMRSASSEGWSIIESVWWQVFGLFELFFKYVDLFPILQSRFFFFGKANPFRR